MDGTDCARSSTPENITKTPFSGTPMFQNPRKSNKRMPLREKVQDSTSHHVPRARRMLSTYYQEASVDDRMDKPKEKWTDAEVKALVEFVLFHSTGDSWPAHKQDAFWSNASEFVQNRAGINLCRSGKKLRVVDEHSNIFNSFSCSLSVQNHWMVSKKVQDT